MLVSGLAVAAVQFEPASRSESSGLTVGPDVSQFNSAALANSVSDAVVTSSTIPPRSIPIEILLLQIENHVRLEQAAAGIVPGISHASAVTPEAASPFVN